MARHEPGVPGRLRHRACGGTCAAPCRRPGRPRAGAGPARPARRGGPRPRPRRAGPRRSDRAGGRGGQDASRAVPGDDPVGQPRRRPRLRGRRRARLVRRLVLPVLLRSRDRPRAELVAVRPYRPMIRTSWLSAMAIVAAGCPAAALADDEPLVVTASRRPLAAEQLPYWVKVVEGPDLEEAESLDAALARLPDVYIQAPGARTGFASLFLRGADPNFTVVMLEGVPLNSPTNSRGGAVNLAAIPAAAIGRAELVAGSASTLYGSGALAGALNLLLPEPTPRPRLSFAGSAGTEGEISGLARWQGPIARGWGATLSALADDAGSATPLSGFASRGLDLLFASQRDSRDRAVVHFAKSRSHGWPDNSGGLMFATRDDLEVRSGKELVLSASHALARFASGRLALSASYLERDDAVTSPGVDASPFSPVGVPAGYDATHYRSIGLRPTLDWTVGEWRATLGVAAQWERGASDGYLDFGIPVPSGFDLRRTTRSVFADLDRVAGPVTFEAGLRFDSVEDGASRTTGRIGLRAALTDRLALKANAGTAWKAPSFYALANPFVGNPDLEPESGSSVELGLEQSFAGDGTLAVTVFRSRYRNLIDFVPGDVPRLENRSIV